MEKTKFECSSCGAIIDIKDAVGVWIECPRCHSRFMINNIPLAGESDDNSKKSYYFPLQCDFQSFRAQCFDLMMQSSPADIFSELKVIEEKKCYLPYVSNIGGDSNSTYGAEYVGTDKHAVILQQYAHLSYKNSDNRFGTLNRSLANENNDLEVIPVDDARVKTLPKWVAHADEVHYYPFYCLVCSYKGTTFTFASLGDSTIKTSQMPADRELRKGPYLIELSNSERISYANIAALVVVALVALGSLLYFKQDISDYIDYQKTYITEHFRESYKFNGWFAYIVYSVYIAWEGIKILFFTIVGAAITYCSSFCVLWLAIVVGVFLRNRYVTHGCLNKLKQAQRRKQHEAYALHNIHLDKLYDKEKDLF